MHFARKISLASLSILLWIACTISTFARTISDFDADWLFSKGDFPAAMMSAYDDSAWQAVSVPHDWSSDGPFSTDFASGTGYAPGGIGWYRKHFRLDPSRTNLTVAVEFDGIYDNSEVWINGQYVGGRPYGYSSFQCDLTPFVKYGSHDNVVAVRVDHSRFADSRYYTGSGIYRNVRLVVADQLHIAHWGVSITTPEIKADFAEVQIKTTVENSSGTNQSFVLETDIVGLDGQIVATTKTHAKIPAIGTAVSGDPSQLIVQKLVVHNPLLWNLNNPQLYYAQSRVLSGETAVDEVTNAFGFRESHFDANNGFFLNGKNLKIKGVCLHHDAGSIGAAVPDKVLERRLLALKEIGVNAIRTSHNPPDPGLLDLCDRLGFLVMDEAFDEFTPGKNKWITGRNNGIASHSGYNEIFAQWSVTDIQDLVRRDRNHPSIILWSIGNEIDYANDPFSHPMLGDDYHPHNPPAEDLVTCARPLIAAVKSLDHTRPVTAALATVSMSDAVGLAQLLDVAGYNYQEWRYAEDHRQYPHRILYGSENGHRYGAWQAVQTNSFISGQFLWTGVDYLGEASEWPNRASGAGLLDLCGFKKPLGWFRQSLWSDRPMVYLCVSDDTAGAHGFPGVEGWNWPANSTVTVLCFANCPEVTLMLNGKTVGTKNMSEAEHGMLRWEVPYAAGTLEAVGHADGQEVCRYALQTTGEAAGVKLLADSTQLHADGKDVCHLEFEIVDAQGRRVPSAGSTVSFDISGPCKLLGIGNGDVSSVEDCKTKTHHAYQGRGLAILQSLTVPGEITVKATAPGLTPADITLQAE